MKLLDLTLREFLESAAAGTAVPGGGSIAALCGALGAALAAMAARLTIDKKGYEEHRQAMKELAEKAIHYRDRLAAFMDQDAAAYQEVMNALKLPRQTDAEKAFREQTRQKALKTAAGIPLEVARDGMALLEIFTEVIGNGNRNAVSDGAAGALAVRAGILAALYNVKINLTSISDSAFVTETRREVMHMEISVEKQAQQLLVLTEKVMGRL